MHLCEKSLHTSEDEAKEKVPILTEILTCPSFQMPLFKMYKFSLLLLLVNKLVPANVGQEKQSQPM